METDLKKYGEFGEAIQAAINDVCEKRIAELLTSLGESEEAKAMRLMRERILAKEFITAREAATLLSCSDSHIRKLINLAKQGNDKRPIPYTPLGDDLTVFNTKDLLVWAKPYIKTNLRAIEDKAA